MSNHQILQKMAENQTYVCCGLDPDLTKFPKQILKRRISSEEKVLEFLKGVVTVTAPHVCCYKAQKAFFDLLPGGHEVLKEIIAFVHKFYPGLPVIVDCKIGDIDNTMQAYTENLFGLLNADGIVVNPYMGDDVLEPLSDFPDKTIVVLVKTSNPKSKIVQDIKLEDGRPLWRYMLDLVINRWDKSGNMVPVIASTSSFDAASVRRLIPNETPILFAGVGAQGGSFQDFAKLLNTESLGVFVNSSRGILFPEPSENLNWKRNIKKAVIELKEKLNLEAKKFYE